MSVVAIAIGVYANTFQHGFALDDDVVFLKNSFVQKGRAGIPDIINHGFLYGFNQCNDQSYRPLVLINYAVEQSIFGNNPHVFHRLNVLYYAFLCALLFKFLRLLFLDKKNSFVFLICILFVLHPLHTEVVANIKGRDDILHGIFLLLSLIFSFQYVDTQKTIHRIAGLLCFFLALLCKEIAVTIIALLPLSLWFFRSIKIKKIAQIGLPYFGVLLIYLFIRNAVLDTVTFKEDMEIINNGLAAASNYPDQLATTFSIFAYYIKLLIVPHPLSWDYSYPFFPIVSFSSPVVILTVAAVLSAFVLSIVGLKRKSILAYCFLFFVISFSIVSNFFILIGSTLGERFLFIPSIAFCIFLVWGAEQLIKQFNSSVKSGVLIAVVAGISILYTFKTIDRNKDWESNETLFIAGAKATPNNSRGISALATVYRERGEQSQSQTEQIKNYNLAIQYYRQSILLYAENSSAYYNLGVVYMGLNQMEQAKTAFESSLIYEQNNINALNNLGVIAFRRRDYAKAEEVFLNCLKLNRNFQNAHANLGAVYHNLGELEKAKQYYSKALQLNPNDLNTKSNYEKLVGVTP